MMQLLVNVGYVLMFCGLVARDVLWLRTILVLGQGAICTYGILMSNPSVAFWNGLFVLINGVRAIQIVLERREIMIPNELRDLYNYRFKLFGPAGFLRLWKRGQSISLENEVLMHEGQANDELFCVLSGNMEVRVAGKEVAVQQRGSLLGEMSVVTGEPVTADVEAVGPARLHRWDGETLCLLQTRRPDQWTRLVSVIGADLIDKIKASHRVQ